MLKSYNVMITGNVQDVGLRSLIEDISRHYSLRGYVFNDTDGSVKMVCRGDSSVIDNFFKEISILGQEKGAHIEDMRKEEIPFAIFLPEKFSRLYTDEIADIGRKLDVGIDVLRDIKSDTSVMPDIKADTSMIREVKADTSILKGIKTDTSVLSSFVSEQRIHNKNLEKLIEK